MANFIRNLRQACLLMLLIAAATLFFRLGELPFIGPDEPRYARIAEEMLLSDRWVTPVLEGFPWLEKPPLYYWITIPVYELFGVREATARLGPAFLALLASLSILWLGHRLYSLRAGVYGAAILLTSLGFASFGRGASTDMPLTACLTIGLSILGAAAAGDRISPTVLFAGYGLLGAAVLAKGPVALVIAAGTLLTFWCFDHRTQSWRRWRLGWGILVIALVSLPWFLLVFVQNGYSFITVFLINHNLVRYVSDIHHHEQPFYYYLPILLALLFPWSGWLPLLKPSMASIRHPARWNPATLFLVCWILLPLVFFSLSSAKLPGYILPVLPPLALLLGSRLAQLAEANPSPERKAARRFHVGLSLSVGAALPLIFNSSFGGSWRPGLWIGVAVILPAVAVWIFSRMGAWRRAVAACILQGILLIVAFTEFGLPLLGRYHSTRDIAREAIALRSDGEPAVSYRFFHHTLRYYSDYTITTELKTPQSLADFADGHSRFLVITEAHRVRELLDLPASTTVPLGEQGKLRLLRVTRDY